MSEWSGSGATDRLHDTLSTYHEAASRQANEMVRLTRQLVILTWVLAVGLAVQVALAIVG